MIYMYNIVGLSINKVHRRYRRIIMNSLRAIPGKYQGYIEKFFLTFILVQPFLDLTSYIGSPVSNIIRVLAMIIGLIYLLGYPAKRVQIIGSIYVIMIGTFMIINVINNYLVKEPFLLVEELTYNVKSAFVIEMLIVYLAVFLSIRIKENWENIIQKYIFINMTIISLVMILATLLGSGKRSYGSLVKEGHSGWFFSANELSAILGLGFGIMIIYLLKKETIKKKIILLPGVLLTVWSMMMIGTKVGLGAVILVLGVAFIVFLVRSIVTKSQWINVGILCLISLLTFIYVPYSPVGNNLNFTLIAPEINNAEENPEDISDEQNFITDDVPDVDNINKPGGTKKNHAVNDIANRVLSGRGDFFSYTVQQYREADLSQKLFGMGPGGNYEKNPKLIEMDYFDWFFSYGIIGFILLIAPLLFTILVIVKRLFKYKFRQISPTFVGVAVAVGLGLGISLFAGHILLNPASGIYLSLLLSYLYVLSLPKEEI